LLAATSDLITEDVFRNHIRPHATAPELRRAASLITLGLGGLTWLACLGNFKTLGEILFLTGPLVASTIWPIGAGLYWKRVNTVGVIFGMVLGSGLGLVAYFMIGWYTAALVGAAVSMACVLGSTLMAPANFDWQEL